MTPFGQPSPFREVALALLEAEEETNQAGTLRKAMANVEPQFILDLISVGVSTIAFRSEESPRSIYEMLFSTCPSDEQWEGILEVWRGEGYEVDG